MILNLEDTIKGTCYILYILPSNIYLSKILHVITFTEITCQIEYYITSSKIIVLNHIPEPEAFIISNKYFGITLDSNLT